MKSIELRLSLVQCELHWEDRQKNLSHIEGLLAQIPPCDLILLPEMFPSGFTMAPSAVGEAMDGETMNWMRRMAAQSGAALCGSVVINEKGKYFNRLLFVKPDGTCEVYDKRHLFTLAGEDKVYTAGTSRSLIEYHGWKICPLICYDLRFPVFSRNTENYHLLLYVANWPEPRITAWDALLKARAIENVCYVAGVNRVGTDANGHVYAGHSNACDFFGNLLLDQSETEEVRQITLRRDLLLEAREKFAFLDDQDRFTVM